MTLIIQSGHGPERAPDFEEFVKTLNPTQLAFLANLLRHAAEQDYGVLEEFYMWVANTFMEMDDTARSNAAHEATERFFTVKAWERYQAEATQAQEIGREMPEGRIVLPGEEHNGHKRR